MAEMKPLLICNLGRLDYGRALEIQLDLLEKRQADVIGDVLLLVEHPPVLTLGTRGESAHIYRTPQQLAADGVQVYEVNRGGDVTYHGPGQIVGYPIMNIEHDEDRIHGFVQSIQRGLIRLLDREFAIQATARTGKYTGVWVGDAKIVAIGIAVKKWVTMHGFAFNVNTDLSHFDWINPCGLSMPATSVAALTGRPADLDRLTRLVGLELAEAFGRSPREIAPEDLIPDWPEKEAGEG